MPDNRGHYVMVEYQKMHIKIIDFDWFSNHEM